MQNKNFVHLKYDKVASTCELEVSFQLWREKNNNPLAHHQKKSTQQTKMLFYFSNKYSRQRATEQLHTANTAVISLWSLLFCV
uniref:Uncharacterized protein n=1 Tax=Anguilla anguilla TaxID=7936 RepID=A0A0E9RRQ3_ANGAN